MAGNIVLPRDPDSRYGLISRAVHWIIAALIIALIPLGWYMVGLEYYDPWSYDTLEIHKALGMVVLLLATVMMSWQIAGRRTRATESPVRGGGHARLAPEHARERSGTEPARPHAQSDGHRRQEKERKQCERDGQSSRAEVFHGSPLAPIRRSGPCRASASARRARSR